MERSRSGPRKSGSPRGFDRFAGEGLRPRSHRRRAVAQQSALGRGAESGRRRDQELSAIRGARLSRLAVSHSARQSTHRCPQGEGWCRGVSQSSVWRRRRRGIGLRGRSGYRGREQDLVERVHSFEQAGEYEKAIDCVDQALAEESKQPNAWYIRGCCLQQLGELEEAIASLDRSLELDPSRPEAWYHKGVSEHLCNANAEAASSLAKFLSLAKAENHRGLIEDARHRQQKLAAGASAAGG